MHLYFVIYRVGEEYKALSDPESALSYILESFKKWNVEVQRISVNGFYASDHIAGLGTMGKTRLH